MSKEDDTKKSILLAAIGNPNIDINIKVNDDTYLFEKYEMPYDGHKKVSVEFMETLENEFKQRGYEITRSPGGCAQNTLRVFQWLNHSKFDSVMIGSVGADEEAGVLRTEMEKQGVITSYTTINDHRTSSVFIFIYRECRSNVYNDTGAAAMYSLSHLLNDTIAMKAIENSKIFHFDGFFSPHSPDVGFYVLNKCLDHSVITSFNIGDVYVVNNSNAHIIPFIKTCNIVSGNSTEFIALCRLLQIPTENVKEAALTVHKFMLKEFKPTQHKLRDMDKYKKILIITDGEKDILCVTSCDGLIEYKVSAIKQNRIRDTIGAGDSFLAGFLFGIVHELPLIRCLEIGCKAAAEIIQQEGCTIPVTKPKFAHI